MENKLWDDPLKNQLWKFPSTAHGHPQRPKLNENRQRLRAQRPHRGGAEVLARFVPRHGVFQVICRTFPYHQIMPVSLTTSNGVVAKSVSLVNANEVINGLSLFTKHEGIEEIVDYHPRRSMHYRK